MAEATLPVEWLEAQRRTHPVDDPDRHVGAPQLRQQLLLARPLVLFARLQQAAAGLKLSKPCGSLQQATAGKRVAGSETA
jgi:hypothetical protein